MLTAVVKIWGVDWDGFATAAGTCIIALGVFIAIYALSQDRRSQHSSIAAGFSQRWISQEMTQVRIKMLRFGDTDDLRDGFLKARHEEPELYYELARELGFFEELAVLHRNGGVSLKWIRNLLGSSVCDRWRIWEPAVIALRDVTKHKSHYEHFEWLAHRLSDSVWTRLGRWSRPKLRKLADFRGPEA